MFAALFSLTVTLYAAILFFFFLGLFSTRETRTENQPFVSIVIPVRNEKDHIENILQDVTHQTYPVDSYEIIIVDDESSDITPNLVQAFSQCYPNVKLVSSQKGSPHLKNKKRALDVGIRVSKGEIVLVTDADCRVTSRWVETMISYFAPEVGLVIGYSQVNSNERLNQQIEALDFLMLSAAARSTAQFGVPFACTGQNLAYRRAGFDEVDGFSTFADALGGDDNFLLQSVRKKTSWEIVSALDPNSFTRTSPCKTRSEFVSQRIRWASDALYFKEANPLFFFAIVTTFLANLFPVASAIGLIFGLGSLSSLTNGLTIKFLAEGFMMAKATSLFKCRDLRKAFVPWFLLQMPYVIYIGLTTLAGKTVTWGGRQSE